MTPSQTQPQEPRSVLNSSGQRWIFGYGFLAVLLGALLCHGPQWVILLIPLYVGIGSSVVGHRQ